MATHEGARLTDDAYGIRRAIELLRRLPPGERGLLVQVVKLTLESANVRVATIVDDANSREAEIDQRIAVLQREVHEREEEISTRREEIANLEVEQKEISHVRQQLSSVPEQVAPPKVVNARPNDDPTVAEGDDLGRALSVLRTT